MKNNPSDIFETIRRERNGVAGIHTAFSSFPEGIAAHYEFYKKIILAADLPLARAEREYLAWMTSEANSCPYCIGHHKAAFRAAEGSSFSSDKTEILGALARELTVNPWKASQLRTIFLAAGYSDAQWGHAVMVVGYFNFANRCAHAMDLELETNFEATCE
jgi:uncharacterized peroxidase-related enzyme